MLSGGEEQGDDPWKVTLVGSDRGSGPGNLNDDTATDGTITGPNWTGKYYGTADADTHPAALMGEFSDEFLNGQVTGAFGAFLQDDDK